MPELDFVGGAYLDYSPNVNAQECMNFYPVLDQQEGKMALYPTPGLKSHATILAANPIRGLHKMGTDLYIAVGAKLYKRTSGGSNSELGSLDTSSGVVYFADNGSKLMLTDGTEGYTYISAAFAKIADADFPTPGTLTFMDGYFIVSEAGTGNFYISALDDPTSWSATDTSSAEGDPDNLVRVINHQNDLWLLGATSLEIWYNAATTFPFERIKGGMIRTGCIAAASVFEFDRYLYFIDDKKRAVRSLGLQTERISTPQIEYIWGQQTSITDAIGFAYSDEGHDYAVFTFPTANFTYVYDITTGFWHKRASYSTDGRWRGQNYVYFENTHLVGDHTNGKLLEIDSATYQDDSNTINRKRTAKYVRGDRKRVFHHRVELQLQVGHAALNPTLKYSDDGGVTFTSAGAKVLSSGDYKARAIWRRLGSARERVYQLTISDNAKIVVVGAHLDAKAGLH
jgi:hypothetical protein